MLRFAERLRQLRQEKKFLRQDVANIMGVTVRAYQYYEEGKREPSLEKLVALAAYLKVSTDYLLGVKDQP